VELKLQKKSESPDRHARESGHPKVFEIPGFRVALAIASLPGMTLSYSTDFGNTTLADLTRNITYTETNKLSAASTVNVVQD
jgi:hypothetical protein